MSARELLSETTPLNPEQVFALIDRVLPFEVCLHHQVLPLGLDGDRIHLGIAELDSEGLAYVQQLLSHLNYQVAQELVPIAVQQQLLSAFLNYDRQLKAAGHVGPIDRSQPRPVPASDTQPSNPGHIGATHPSSMVSQPSLSGTEADRAIMEAALAAGEATEWTEVDDPLDRTAVMPPIIEYSDWMEAGIHDRSDSARSEPDQSELAAGEEAVSIDPDLIDPDLEDQDDWLATSQLPTVIAPLGDYPMTDARSEAMSESAVAEGGLILNHHSQDPDSALSTPKGEEWEPQSPAPTILPLRSDSSPTSPMTTLTEHPTASALGIDRPSMPVVDEPDASQSHRSAIDPAPVSDLGAMTISPPPGMLGALTEAASHELPAALAQLEQDLVKALEPPVRRARSIDHLDETESEMVLVEPTAASPFDYGAPSPQVLVLQTRYADRPLSELDDLPPRALIQELLQRAIEGGIGRLYFDRPERDRARILCSRDGILQAALDPLPPSTFQGVIDELKLLADLPLLPPVGKARQVEIERTYRDELLLLRLRIAPGRLGEEVTLQVLRGAALKFHQRQQLAKLGHDAIDLTRQLQKKLAAMQARAALSPDLDPRLQELTHLQDSVQNLIERLASW